MNKIFALFLIITTSISISSTACHLSSENSLAIEVQNLNKRKEELVVEIRRVMELVRSNSVDVDNLTAEQSEYAETLNQQLNQLLLEVQGILAHLKSIKESVQQ